MLWLKPHGFSRGALFVPGLRIFSPEPALILARFCGCYPKRSSLVTAFLRFMQVLAARHLVCCGMICTV